jgi:hypothetical protein
LTTIKLAQQSLFQYVILSGSVRHASITSKEKSENLKTTSAESGSASVAKSMWRITTTNATYHATNFMTLLINCCSLTLNAIKKLVFMSPILWWARPVAPPASTDHSHLNPSVMTVGAVVFDAII